MTSCTTPKPTVASWAWEPPGEKERGTPKYPASHPMGSTRKPQQLVQGSHFRGLPRRWSAPCSGLTYPVPSAMEAWRLRGRRDAAGEAPGTSSVTWPFHISEISSEVCWNLQFCSCIVTLVRVCSSSSLSTACMQMSAPYRATSLFIARLAMPGDTSLLLLRCVLPPPPPPPPQKLIIELLKLQERRLNLGHNPPSMSYSLKLWGGKCQPRADRREVGWNS